jgi:membrane protein YdbS with pleckstrin-like domain
MIKYPLKLKIITVLAPAVIFQILIFFFIPQRIISILLVLIITLITGVVFYLLLKQITAP